MRKSAKLCGSRMEWTGVWQPLSRCYLGLEGKHDAEWVWAEGQEEPPVSQVPRAVRVASLLSEGEELSDDQGDEEEDDQAYEGIPK